MKKQWWQEEVVYQIYPKSFKDSNHDGIGDIQGIISKLDYLKELGITMLWICPIFQSPMDDNGYDISDYFALAPEFGTMDDLRQLIDEAKGKGISIILDLVINHTSDEHPWFQEALSNPESKYHDFYIFKQGKEVPNNWRSVFGTSVWEKVEGRDEYYLHCFGKKQPDLNWENPEVRKALYDIVNRWLDFGIAGFRVDAITFIKKDQTYQSYESDGVDQLVKCTKTCRNQPGIDQFLKELKQNTFDRHACVSVAEAPGVRYDELDKFIGDDGYFSMIFDFKHADLDVASGSEWFKRVDWTIKDLNTRIMTSQLAIQKVGWAANFIENHDQPRATSKYLKDFAQHTDAVKMMGAMYFFLRGTPFIYQGQELGMINAIRNSIEEFNDISSIDQYHRAIEEGCSEEEALHYINLRSRDQTRTPFPWNDERYGGFSDHEPWLLMNETYTSINAKAQINDPESVLSFYKEMIAFRQHSAYKECLIYGDIVPISTHEQIIAYQRNHEDKTIYCYFNFSNESIKEPCDKHIKQVIFHNLKRACYETSEITLQPFQAVLLEVD